MALKMPLSTNNHGIHIAARRISALTDECDLSTNVRLKRARHQQMALMAWAQTEREALTTPEQHDRTALTTGTAHARDALTVRRFDTSSRCSGGMLARATGQHGGP